MVETIKADAIRYVALGAGGFGVLLVIAVAAYTTRRIMNGASSRRGGVGTIDADVAAAIEACDAEDAAHSSDETINVAAHDSALMSGL